MARQRLYLAGGPQSSGSTLVSWCFLQRHDLDGVLDARFDRLPDPLPAVATPFVWCKVTVACFRLVEVVEHFLDAGYDVCPLLVVRDVRAVFHSLVDKPYGRNGTTADDPPLRMRLRRFLADYADARRLGWPILRFEDVADVRTAEAALRSACAQLGLPWDEAMLTWPKSPESLADPRHGNATFRRCLGRGLAASVRSPGRLSVGRVPRDDLAWLERTFASYNAELGYPATVSGDASPPGRAVPQFAVTRAAWRERPRGWRRLQRWLSRPFHGWRATGA
ncbi:MAG: hypothetical protein ACK4PI_11940 [Tepidisphaerales bacterium]